MADESTEFSKQIAEFQKHTRFPGNIEFPIQVSAVETLTGRNRPERVGLWCSIRPVSDPKTYLGVYLGDLTLSVDHYYHVENKTLTISPHSNPAIFVPDLKRVVWGIESWWDFIATPEQLHAITDADIQNVWYVKALKELSAKMEPRPL